MGEDCCACECTDNLQFSCGVVRFDCLDPDARLQLCSCEETRPVAVPCPTDRRGERLVSNTAQVKALAETCSRGTFDVKWEGDVVVDETIHVANGTLFNLTSVGFDAAVDGDGATQLFMVVNASFHMSDITIRNGSAISGGAIASPRYTLTFNQTAFVGNTATDNRGALYVSESYTVIFGQRSDFVTACLHSGDVSLESGFNISWSGTTTFSGNIAGASGGELDVRTSSNLFNPERPYFQTIWLKLVVLCVGYTRSIE